MRKIFRNALFISFMILILSISTVFAAAEKSLVTDTEDFRRSYGNSTKITAEEHSKIIELIKKTGKTDFKEGFYAEMRDSSYGPSSSEGYIVIDDVKGYNKLRFDVCAMSQDKFKDLEANIYWDLYMKEEEQDYDTFKKDYTFTEGTDDKFNIEKIADEEYPSSDGKVQIHILDKEWNYKYAITASNQWETVELDISDFDELTFYFSISGSASALVANPRLVGETTQKPAQPTPQLKAVPNSSSVTVNGQTVAFDAYTINDNNYFKLRDLAKVLTGTEKQFEVTWDGTKNAINLVSGQPYTTVGGELSKGDGNIIEPKESTSIIYKDGEVIKLKAYTISNNNYFKLRDIGEAFDFGVFWDSATKTIRIDTSTGYAAE